MGGRGVQTTPYVTILRGAVYIMLLGKLKRTYPLFALLTHKETQQCGSVVVSEFRQLCTYPCSIRFVVGKCHTMAVYHILCGILSDFVVSHWIQSHAQGIRRLDGQLTNKTK